MGKKSPPPKAPDLQPVTDAQMAIAEQSNELAREQLGLSKEQFKWMQENSREELALAREQADKLFEFQQKAFDSDEEAKAFARDVGQSQIDAMEQQMGYATKDRERYESVFLPMQDKYIEEANAYDTPERRESEASKAMVDIQRQSEAARANSDARLRSMGLDPSQMRSATLLDTQNVTNAAQQALAGNTARTGVENQGRAMRADAMNIGMGLPAQSTTGFAGAGAAGQGALGAGTAGQNAQLGAIQGGANVAGTAMGFRSNALNNVAALTGSPMQWAQMGSGNLGSASSQYGQAANTSTQNYNNQMSSWKAGQEQSQQAFNNVMSVASLAAGAMMAEGGQPKKKRAAITPISGYSMAETLIKGDSKPDFETTKPGKPTKDTSFWAQVEDRRSENDKYIRQGSGSGKGGKLSMLDRLDNAATMGQNYAPKNVWEGQTNPSSYDNMTPQSNYAEGGPQRALPTPPRFGMAGTAPTLYGAEGGHQRARGAIPVRQVRDKIPALLAEGEYVLPADVVRSVGLNAVDKMVKKYHREGA